MVGKDIATGSLITLLNSHRLLNTEREQISVVYYQSSTVGKRISVFLDFIKPRLQIE